MSRLRQATVMVVDDEAALREILTRFLSRHGHRVVAAAGAEAALELLGVERPDVLLLDVHLPTMSGLALYLAAVARWPELAGRVAILTGGDPDAELWAERNGCGLIRKPFELAEIDRWVEGVLTWRGRLAGNS